MVSEWVYNDDLTTDPPPWIISLEICAIAEKSIVQIRSALATSGHWFCGHLWAIHRTGIYRIEPNLTAVSEISMVIPIEMVLQPC